MAFIFKKANYGDSSPTPVPNTGYLYVNDWDDFGFKTMFFLTVFDSESKEHQIGNLKIGFSEQEEAWTEKEIPDDFEQLDSKFFSLGQDEEYYQNLYKLSEELRTNILSSLRDVVKNTDILKPSLEHGVMKTSLLRDVSLTTIHGQFKRILNGGDVLSEFHFTYKQPQTSKVAGFELSFDVEPDSFPPTNVHVLIGNNGVGKTQLLNNMVKSLLPSDVKNSNSGAFSISTDLYGLQYGIGNFKELFNNVVSVAFSAFDPFEPIPEVEDKTKSLRYTYVGLKRATNRGGKKGTPMSREMLTNEFVESFKGCLKKGLGKRWVEAVNYLEIDLTKECMDLVPVTSALFVDMIEPDARKMFKNLSSGHSIVLLTITKLVEKVSEKTLVLLDEPESHLHPPLLSAFIRALSELLSYRNGVAIIATHSPVILQEVPKSCVWNIRRNGLTATVERPGIETFGENVSLLTRDAFRLDVGKRSFYDILEKEVDAGLTYKQILRKFSNQIGYEGQAILRSLIANKNKADEVLI
jgi:predicted ATPase